MNSNNRIAPIKLFTPGPTHIPKKVLDAMYVSELHHRTPEFRALFGEVRERLQDLFSALDLPILLACSGTGALEATLVNTADAKTDTLGYLDAGKFGSRWGDIADSYSVSKKALTLPWGDSPTVDQIKDFLRVNSDITHFGIQYCETSTTVLHDLPNITAMIKKEFPDIFLLIDAISAATTLKIDLQALHCDALILASQKAFMLPPGLSMVFLSERYWEKQDSIQPASLYFDLKRERKGQAKNNSAWTPAAGIILGLNAALQIFEAEGWETVYARHAACREYVLNQFTELEVTPVNLSQGSPSVTGGFLENTDVEQFRADLFAKSGYRIAGGQDSWKGKAIRVGHMGVISPEDLAPCFEVMREILKR